MRPTRAAQRAFTYAEMLVVMTVLFLLTAVLVPKYEGMKRGQELRFFRSSLRSLATEARTVSLSSGDTVALGFDKGANEIFALQESSNGKARKLGQIALPAGVSATQLSADQRESADEAWRVPFYADGTSAGGGIEFAAGDEIFSFSVLRGNGRATVKDGELPDLGLEEWTAGGFEPRA